MGLELKPTMFQIRNAQAYLSSTGKVYNTPLIKLETDDLPQGPCQGTNIYLKLENLQFTGSFKVRGGLNALHQLPQEQRSQGVYTASAGNFGQGFAWAAKQLGASCTVIAPDSVPQLKLSGMRRWGADVKLVPYDEWFDVIKTGSHADTPGTFVHPGCQRDVIAANGTIGLEIMEQLPEVTSIVCPYGSGGISCGVALGAKGVRPDVKVYVSEVDTAAPCYWSRKAGHATSVPDYKRSFVDGMGARAAVPSIWPLAASVIDDSLLVSLQEIVDATRVLASGAKVVAEGAGAAPLAAALKGSAGEGNIVCLVSGGNIDNETYLQVLQGIIPGYLR